MKLAERLRMLAAAFGEDDEEPSAVPTPSAVPGAAPAAPGAPSGEEAPAVPQEASPAVPGEPAAPAGPPAGGAPPAAPEPAPEPVSDKVVFCCPFDGSGNVIGQSDGSIKCEHCGTVFSVEVRPAMSGLPRFDESGNPVEITEFDGQDYPSTGQAQAEGTEDPMSGDPLGEDGLPNEDDDDNLIEEGAEEEVFGAEDDEGEDDDEDIPDFLKGSALFLTDDRRPMNRKAFVRYLAESDK